MKKYIVLLFIIITVSCQDTVKDEDLANLNGYWEIETAIMPDGTKKEYTVNSTIDYFELQGKEGFRKKVMPQYDGTYRVNSTAEKITIANDNGKAYIYYETEFSKWKEEIIKLSDEQLILKNAQDIEYNYIKPQPFSIK